MKEKLESLWSESSFFAGSSDTPLDMPYVRCLKGCECVARLSNLVILFQEATKFYDALRFIQNLRRWGRDCDIERRIRAAPRPVFSARRNVEMSLAPPGCSSSLHA